jgi:site-specific recombinase XerD
VSKIEHKSLTISNAYNLFVLRCQAERFQPSTLRFYGWTLQPFFAWCEAQQITLLGAVTSHHLRAYLVSKQVIARNTDNQREASGNYNHAIARALRAFFRYCMDDGLLAMSPMTGVKMPRRPKKILEAFSPDDIRRLLRVADSDRDKALVYFLLDTGLRASECVNLKIADIDQTANSVRIRHGKGDKERIAYLGSKTARYLARYLLQRGKVRPTQPLWPNSKTGKPLTYSGLAQLLRRLGRAAGVSNCTPHTFRRTFALNCLRNGMNIYLLARLMGHSDILVLRQYLAITDEDLQTAYERYGVVDNL